MDTTVLRSALYNLNDNSGASDGYARGLVVGIVSALVAYGIEFDRALGIVKMNMPVNARDVLPESWK